MKTKAIIVVLLLTSLVGTSALAGLNTSQRKLSLDLEEVPIVSVLNMIASQNELNLVISGEVDGEVTLRLEDVDVATALDAVLTANGYNYFLKDDIIVVKPMATRTAGELESRLVVLKYLDPQTAQKALVPRLSDKGSVVVLDKTGQDQATDPDYRANRIVITDYPSILDDLVDVILVIDMPERSIAIEAKIIETTIDSKSNLGLSWPTSVGARLSGAEDGTSSSSTTSLDDVEPSAGVYDPSDGSWKWGKLSVDQVSLILNALQQDGNSRLVSDPKVTTLENHTAEFKFETIIPIQTINRFTEGSATSDIVTFEDEEVGLSLTVTPRINEEGRITLDIHPTVEDIIGFNGPPDNQKPITSSRSIHTTVTVNDGETVALGGLIKESDIEDVNKVPLLGSIPLLGKLLFTSKSTEKQSTDLIILITPHILD